MKKPKIIVVLGPTASGKTSLGAFLGKKLKGEIISADSRQVYRRLDLGTGKEKLEIPQHLIDIVQPEQRFTVAEWKKLADKSIAELLQRGVIPVIVGGTSLYIEALLKNYQFGSQNLKLRSELEKMSLKDLQKKLKQINPQLEKEIESNNKRYIIRAIEKNESENGVVVSNPLYDYILLTPKISRQKLYQQIDKRVDDRMDEGMLKEVKDLVKTGISKDWLMSLGLEYRYLTKLVMGELSREEAISKLKFDTHSFARKQLAWWRRGNWPQEIKIIDSKKQALSLAQKFLKD